MQPSRTLLLLAFLLVGTADAQVTPATGMGFRGDGTGIFPAAKPPTSWSDTENVRWKVPLPNWGYACPVPVGDRVFMLVEPDAANPWPRLLCYAAVDGRELWRQDVNPFDALPEVPQAERDRLTGDLKGLYQRYVDAYEICMTGFKGLRTAKPGDPAFDAVLERLEAKHMTMNKFASNYGILRYLKMTDADAWNRTCKQFRQYGITPFTTWHKFGPARVGHAFPTPVATDTHVFVMTRHGTVACFDHTGERAWSRRVPFIGSHGLVASPRIFGDRLLTSFHTGTGKKSLLCAFDLRSGEVLWQVEICERNTCLTKEMSGQKKGYRSREYGSTQVFTVGDTPMVTSGMGRVVRIADGHLYEAGLPGHGGTLAVDDTNDIVFGAGHADGGSQRWAFRLAVDGDDLIITRHYVIPGRSTYKQISPVFLDGRLYVDRHPIDPATGLYRGGKPDGSPPPDRGRRAVKPTTPSTRHLLLVANGHVYGLAEHRGKDKGDPAGICEVYTLAGEKVATNVLTAGPSDAAQEHALMVQGFPHRWSNSCSFNIGPDCLYITSQYHLFCIGAPGVRTR